MFFTVGRNYINNILFGIKQSRKKRVNERNCVKFKIGKIVFQSIPQLMDLNNSKGSHGMYIKMFPSSAEIFVPRNISLFVCPNI